MLQVMTARLPLLFDIVACERGWWIEKRGSAQSPLALTLTIGACDARRRIGAGRLAALRITA